MKLISFKITSEGVRKIRCQASVQGRYSLLGDSYCTTKNRFLNLERKLSKYPDLKCQYKNFIHEYISLNYVEAVLAAKLSSCKYLMPHHCFIRPQSSTTKRRVVSDASCKTSFGKSLNEIQKVGFGSNDMQSRPTSPKCTIKYRSMMPIRYIRYSRRSVSCNSLSASIGTRHDVKSLDMFSGRDTFEESLKLKVEMSEILKCGCFKLRNWASNDERLLSDVPDAHRETFKNIDELWVFRENLS